MKNSEISGKDPQLHAGTYRVEIRARPEKIFPLLCPVREEEWIAGWKPGIYRVLKSESGYVELGSEFEEASLAGFLLGQRLLTRWVTTLYEPGRFAQDFTLHIGDRAVLLREIRLAPAGPGITRAAWTDTLSFLKNPPTPPGKAFIALKLRIFSFWLGRILKYYCEKGRCFPTPSFIRNFQLRAL